MRHISLLFFVAVLAASLSGCRCSDGERPKLFPNLFHRDDVDDRGSKSKTKVPCDDPNTSKRPCNNGFLDNPIAPANYGRPIYTTMPLTTGENFPGGTFGPVYPAQPGRMDELPPGQALPRIPAMPPGSIPIGPEATPRPADPNTKLVK